MTNIAAAFALAAALLARPALAQDAGLSVSFDGSRAQLPTELAARLRAADGPDLARLARSSRDPYERIAALRKLASRGDKDKYVDVIGQAAAGASKDSDAAVRGQAMVILAGLSGGEREAGLRVLAQALIAEQDPEAELTLLYAIARTKDARFTNGLVADLVDAKAPLKVRAAAAIALRECDQKQRASVPYLIRVYSQTAPSVQSDKQVLLVCAGYALRRLAPTKGAPWMTPGQNVIDQIRERHPNLQVLEVLFGFVAGRLL